jgi:hypothetical protein
MDAVSIYDHIIVAIRERRFSKSEMEDVIQEIRVAYPELIEQIGINGEVASVDSKDYDEWLPDQEATGQRPY